MCFILVCTSIQQWVALTGNGHVIDLLLSEELKDQLEAIKKVK